MAKAAVKAVPAAQPAAEAGAKGKGGSRKKLILIAAVGLALGGGGAGAWFYLHRSGAGHAQQEKVKPAAPPVFVNLEPFTVNLQPDGAADQYLQVVAVLRVADNATSDTLRQFMPELRHRMLLLLSGKKAADLGTPAGREKLAGEVRTEANRILSGASGKPQHSAGAIAGQTPEDGAAKAPAPEAPVQSVLFTSFIIQ